MLLKLMLDGAFLVRAGERVQNSFAITFMADKKEGRHFLIRTAQFETNFPSLLELSLTT